MTKKIKIAYFPTALKFIASPLMIAGGLYLALTGHWVWTILLLLLVIIILTTEYVTVIDLKEKRYRDYLYFLSFLLNQESRAFNNLDRIIITKGNYSQKINTKSRSTQLDWSDYTGTLLFDDDGVLDLLTRNDKEELLKGIKEFSEYLQISVEDRTTGLPYWVDMSKF